MKPTFKTAVDMCHYFNYFPTSDMDYRRIDKAWWMYVNDYKGPGCMGCIAEMLTATTNSTKETISNPGANDCWIKYRTENGYIVPVQCERKTSGGRVSTFENELSKAETITGKYVIYSMDVCNKNTGYLRRYVPAVVIPRVLFMQKLDEFKAIKAMYHKRNGISQCDGYGIQVTKKDWFLWLAEYPIVYDRNAVYCDDDFIGLE